MKTLFIFAMLATSAFQQPAQAQVVNPTQQIQHVLKAERVGCHPAVCKYVVSWSVPNAQKTVMTVEVPNEGPEKLMACEGTNGQAEADWVVPGKTYVFRVYASNNCTVDIAKSVQATSHIQIKE